jgi:hypothetical protein
VDDGIFHALEAPPDVIENGGHEVVRASVSDGAVSIAMRRSFDDPFVWGRLLVELARHAARIYAAETDMDVDEAMVRIVEGFQAELDDDSPSGSPGAVN